MPPRYKPRRDRRVRRYERRLHPTLQPNRALSRPLVGSRARRTAARRWSALESRKRVHPSRGGSRGFHRAVASGNVALEITPPRVA